MAKKPTAKKAKAEKPAASPAAAAPRAAAEPRQADPKSAGTDTKSTASAGKHRIYYTPSPGEPKFTTAFGRTFQAGEAVTIEGANADAVFAKLKGNPQFSESPKGDKPAPESKASKNLGREVDRLQREVAEAEEEADESNADRDAKARALAQTKSLKDAAAAAEAAAIQAAGDAGEE